VIAQLHASDPVDVGKAADLLAAGIVVAIPTDTVYGLAVDPSQPGAVDRVFALKKRPGAVALPVLVTGWGQVEMVAGTLEGAAQGFADQYWPGPLTLVVPRRGRFRADLGGELAASWTVGLRWPDHPVVQALCTAIGPLAVTSANRHAEPPATSAEDVIVAFTGDDRLSAVLDGGVCDGAPSTVVECRGPVSRCLREGAIRWDGPTRRPEALD
jgi:tRNA threonylcarbamoyl adenosine modification protein (Sua5/YciO/YrdC/YwlC family)